jgi:hypothetical protein
MKEDPSNSSALRFLFSGPFPGFQLMDVVSTSAVSPSSLVVIFYQKIESAP